MATPKDWEAFHADAIVSGSLSEDIANSWRRSRFSGVHPERPRLQTNDVSLDTPFTRAAVPVMLAASQLLTGADACLALADASGTVIWRWVSGASLGRELDRAGFVERVVFSEEVIGTNGVGTALESRSVATVLGASHYGRNFHGWSCVAAPVFNPMTNRVCGAVNITCRAEDANAFLQLAIRLMAADVRTALYSAANVSQKRLLEAYLTRRSKTLAPLVAVNGQIIISDGPAFDHDTLWQRVKGHRGAGVSADLGDGIAARLWPVCPGVVNAGVVLELEPARAIDPASERLLLVEQAAPADLSPLDRAERAVIVETLASVAGNKSQAADRLRISRRSLYDKLHRYRLRF